MLLSIVASVRQLNSTCHPVQLLGITLTLSSKIWHFIFGKLSPHNFNFFFFVLLRSQILAEQLGIVATDACAPLTEEQWQNIKAISRQRQDAAQGCAICCDAFGLRPQVLLSCSHTFHHQCLTSVEQCIGKSCCPLCRCERYEKRIVFEGQIYWQHRAASRIQAAWRGWRTRRQWALPLERRFRTHPLLRRRYHLQALAQLTQACVSQASASHGAVDELLREIDSTRLQSQLLRQQIAVHQAKSAIDWTLIHQRAAARYGSTSSQDADIECAVCLQGLDKRPLALLNCTHVLHAACLASLENFCPDNATCPMCRQSYVKYPDVLTFAALTTGLTG